MHELGVDAYTDVSTNNMSTRMLTTYHAGLDSSDQKHVLSEFRKKESNVRLVICTVAFGLGVNVSDVSIVIHWGGCTSVLEYWQEIGRCGRNGEPTTAMLYATPATLIHVDDNMKHICTEASRSCVRQAILKELSIASFNFYDSLIYRSECNAKCADCKCQLCMCCTYCHNTCACRVGNTNDSH